MWNELLSIAVVLLSMFYQISIDINQCVGMINCYVILIFSYMDSDEAFQSRNQADEVYLA